MGRGAYLRIPADGSPQSLYLCQGRVDPGALTGGYDPENGNLLSDGKLLYVAR